MNKLKNIEFYNQSKLYQVNKYCNSYQFKLKNYNKTLAKYSDYKNKKYNDMNINNLFNFMQINDIAKNVTKHGFFEILKQNDLSKKGNIKQLATLINTVTKDYIYNFIKNHGYNTMNVLNNNEKRIFTIKFYLNNYESINNIMNRILLNLTMKVLCNQL